MTEFTRELISSLADIPIASTEGMSQNEAIAGVAQMISDLQRLAQKDGCIADGWALEVLAKVSHFETGQTKATNTIYRLFH